MAKGDALPDDHHVVRHVPGTKIEQGGQVNGAAFVRRQSEDGLSVEWRQASGDRPVVDQLQAIRAVFRRQLKASHRFAEIPVGATREKVREGAAALGMQVDLRSEHQPLEQVGEFPEDPFHSEIFGAPEFEHLKATAIGDLIAQCVTEQYPAIA